MVQFTVIKTLKSEKKFGKVITFKVFSAKPEKGTFVIAYSRGRLVSTAKTKRQAFNKLKEAVVRRLG